MSSCYTQFCDKSDFFTYYPRATQCPGMTPPPVAATATENPTTALNTPTRNTGPTATSAQKNGAAAMGLAAGTDAMFLSVGVASGLLLLFGAVI
jgi:hypothetical protein